MLPCKTKWLHAKVARSTDIRNAKSYTISVLFAIMMINLSCGCDVARIALERQPDLKINANTVRFAGDIFVTENDYRCCNGCAFSSLALDACTTVHADLNVSCGSLHREDHRSVVWVRKHG